MNNVSEVIDFNVRFDKAVTEQYDWLERVFQRFCQLCQGSIIVGDPGYSPGTPVRTGFARNGWYVVVMEAGGIPSGPGPQANVAPKNAAFDLGAGGVMDANEFLIAKAKLGQTVWLVNNVIYIIALEYGHSQQAPAGMVRLTKSAAQEILNQAVRETPRRAA